jgi:hypothetical protein
MRHVLTVNNELADREAPQAGGNGGKVGRAVQAVARP